MVLKQNGNTLLLVQCKQWKAWKAGVQVVREIFGVMTARKALGLGLLHGHHEDTPMGRRGT